MKLLVRRAGFLTTVQDLGRTGHRSIGVSLGGALDPHALRIANLLAGNEPSAAGLEISLGNVRLGFEDDRLIAWAGGDFAVQFGNTDLPAGHAGLIRAGEELSVQALFAGGRAWLAISGGIDLPEGLGSRSTHLRGEFGGLNGRALRDGDLLPLGEITPTATRILRKLERARVSDWFAPPEWTQTIRRHGILRVIPGADWSRFSEADRSALLADTFKVATDSDRMGIRLEGPQLHSQNAGDLLSEAVAPGTIQVPPNGQPIVLLGDCQTIGGYPKIAHMITVDLPAAAQLRAGDAVRFAAVSLADAQRFYLEREADTAFFRAGLELRTA